MKLHDARPGIKRGPYGIVRGKSRALARYDGSGDGGFCFADGGVRIEERLDAG